MASSTTTLFPDFEPFTTTTQTSPEVTIHGLKSKNHSSPSASHLPAILLLHGFPQTLHIWHLVAPRLTPHFRVVLLDLRGYGSSSKPTTTTTSSPSASFTSTPESIAQYAKSAMATDCAHAMSHLSHATFSVAAHDRGARVAHKLCVDHPHRVTAALLMDICPTLAMYESTNRAFASAYWHWFFLPQKAPLPELMILGNPGAVAARFMGGGKEDEAGLDMFRAEAYAEYVKALADPATVHGMCQDYRAAATVDLEEQRADAEAGRLVRCPVTVLWGKFGTVEKCFDALAEWRKVTAEGVSVEGRAVESGHYIPEERPDDVVAAILKFLE